MSKRIDSWLFIAGLVGISVASFGAVPVVSNVRMTQDVLHKTTITYDLSGAPDSVGIVTLDIQTNGVSIGAENIQYLTGDVNRELGTGPHTISWRPDKSWEGHAVSNTVAKISVWEKSTPPDYMTVNLVNGSVHWYTCAKALPEGIGSDLYREDLLLMRRIKRPNRGAWVMGSPASENLNAINEIRHQVTLTNDYWIGVFEVTQWQWQIIKGDKPSLNQGDNWATRPVEWVSYDAIRGADECYYYPKNPDPNSFLGLLRTKTGIQSFDLPSEMQWEFACRAGTKTKFNNGRDEGLDELGCCNNSPEKHSRVGSYLPNDWGIYDMHGNVCEWCLDWYAEDISRLDGSVNITSGDNPTRILRGGSWYNVGYDARSADRNFHYKSNFQAETFGFRLTCSADLIESAPVR